MTEAETPRSDNTTPEISTNDGEPSVSNERTPVRELSPAAKRALAEATARREEAEKEKLKAERELGGRGGLDPARYGDWEIKGRAIDF